MVRIPEGTFLMGSDDPSLRDARPVHRVRMRAFWMDRTVVTNAQFAKFVAVTGYVTDAERKPNLADYPDADPRLLVPGSLVFSPPPVVTSLDDANVWWRYVPGANWRHPSGPRSSIVGLDQYPVVQVSHRDALAYCRWAGKRLPTEAEFEYAARGGLVQKRFAWGDELRPEGKWQANIFQGSFPSANTAEDGYAGLAPARAFPANRFGLYGMAGNVWQWCADVYRADAYAHLSSTATAAAEVRDAAPVWRVQRGGSFLCTDQYCSGYYVAARGKGDETSATNHAGFRCVADLTPADRSTPLRMNP